MPPPTNTILSVHPSHAAPEERCFWKEVLHYMGVQGWNHVPVTHAQMSPCTGNDLHVQRPHDRGSMAERCAAIMGGRLPAWATDADIAVLSEWMKLAYPSENSTQVPRNLKAYAAWVEVALATLRPAAVILTSVLPLTMLFGMAARHYGIKTILYERSPCGGIWLEPEGNFADAAVWRLFPQAAAQGLEAFRPAGEATAAALCAQPGGFRQGEDGGACWRSGPKAGPVFLMMMDNVVFSGWRPAGWPKQKATYPLYETPELAIAHVAGLVRKLGGTLVLKRHPICRVFGKNRPPTLPEDVIYYDGPVADALKAADVIITFISKTAFPALAMGKPVVTLACNPVDASGSTYHPATQAAVADTLRDALDQKDLRAKRERFVPFLGWMAKAYYYHYASHPPVFPEWAALGGFCAAQRGPGEFLAEIFNQCPPAVHMPAQELAPKISFLKILAGQEFPGKVFDLPQHLRASLNLLSRFAKTVAIYGAGKMARAFFQEAHAKDIFADHGVTFALFDDQAGGQDCCGVAVRPSRELAGFVENPEAVVVLATDTWQAPMRARLHELGVADHKIIDLFN